MPLVHCTRLIASTKYNEFTVQVPYGTFEIFILKLMFLVTYTNVFNQRIFVAIDEAFYVTKSFSHLVYDSFKVVHIELQWI